MKFSAIVINVPNTLVRPGLTRKDAFTQQWTRSELSKIFELSFLEKVCTPSEIVQTPELMVLAKRHDTFFQPNLRKALLGVSPTDRLSDQQKQQSTDLAEAIIAEHWDKLIEILQKLNFSCRDDDAIKTQAIDTPWTPVILSGLLDAVRTKLTRTACTESHLRAYRKLQQSEAQVGLLFEDDVVILPQIKGQLNEAIAWLNQHDPDWNIVQLAWSKLPDRPATILEFEDSPLIASNNGAYGNSAVLVNLTNQSAQKIVDLIETHRSSGQDIVANDVILAEAKLAQYLVKTRYIGPPLGEHSSVIAGKDMDYTKVCWDQPQIDQIKAMIN